MLEVVKDDVEFIFSGVKWFLSDPFGMLVAVSPQNLQGYN